MAKKKWPEPNIVNNISKCFMKMVHIRLHIQQAVELREAENVYRKFTQVLIKKHCHIKVRGRKITTVCS